MTPSDRPPLPERPEDELSDGAIRDAIRAAMPKPTQSTDAPFETVDYQARLAAEHRPCGLYSCVAKFPGMPARWCSGCLIAALLERLDMVTRKASGNYDAHQRAAQRRTCSVCSCERDVTHAPRIFTCATCRDAEKRSREDGSR